MYFLVLAFALIGGGLKYVDDAFDEGLYSKKRATGVAGLLVVLWIALSLLDAYSATILTAVLLGVLLSGKVDNPPFKVSALLIVLTTLTLADGSILLLPLAVLTVFAVLDEKGNDYVDRNRVSWKIGFFFAHRFAFKLALLAVCALSMVPFLYFLAFLCFDIAYDSVGLLGSPRPGKMQIKESLSSLYRKIIYG